MVMLKRIGRYLRGAARCVQYFHWSSEDEDLLGFADSDWAGSKRDAKSTSGGVLFWCGHLLKGWSTGQSTIAMSSGEAELYALTKLAAADVWDSFPWLQISARLPAPRSIPIPQQRLGMVFWSGLGRTRHVRVQYLWIQQKVQDKELVVEKVDTKENVADLMTKSLSAEVASYFMLKLGIYRADGRSNLTPEIALMTSGEADSENSPILKRHWSVGR